MNNQDQRISEFIAECKTRALSVTPQRLAIYKALINDISHPNPESIYNTIRPDFPTISLATVYKTLETLEKHHIISVVTPLHETVRYDAITAHHHHVVCIQCKKIMDLEDSCLNEVQIPEVVSKENQVLDYSVQFNVICSTCKAA